MSAPSDSNRIPPVLTDAERLQARRRLLALKAQQKEGLQSTAGAVQPNDTVPLSFAQEGLWFLDQLASGSAAYNIHSLTRLLGPLDAPVLERSLQALIARHASLRTFFRAAEQGPMQQVMPAVEALARFRITRTTVPPGEDLEARLAQCIAQPFDLSRAPLMRAELLQIAPDHHVLVLVVHHIVADGWSMSIIHRELRQLYAGNGTACDLPDIGLQFPDFAVWQRERFESGALNGQLAYWRENLHDLQRLEVPTDKPRPAQASFVGQTFAFRIDPLLTAALRALAQRQGATLFMTLLAAFHALLMRYAGQSDIAVGVPLAGRDDARLADTVGYFVNTVVIRTDLDDQVGYAELLRRMRQVVLGAMTHQDMPFDRLVAELSPERDASRNPLYQVAFALENFPHRVLELPGLRSERLGMRSKTAKFDLSLTLTETGDHLEAGFEYRSDLFEASTIGRLGGHFLALLAGVAADPEGPVASLPLFDATERHRLLVEWNDRARTRPNDGLVHTLFRAQARRTPEATALCFGPTSLSYRALDALSEQLAHTLRERGVGPDVVVGLCMQRCFGLVVGFLASFKAGGVYLPLDPDHPAERLEAMLVDAAPAVVLTQARFADRLRQLAPLAASSVIDVPDDGGQIPAEPLPALIDTSGPEQLAYLIFTSGSTGRPKAAQLLHRGLSNHVLWMNDVLGLDARDRVLHKTSISFDASIWELFSPLVCGATLVLAQPEVHRDMGRLAKSIEEQAISVVQFVPSELRVALDELEPGRCRALRFVLSGGEALDRVLALSFRSALPHVRLGNFYGPSEASVDSAWYEVGDHLPERPLVPIGRPVANMQLYVLDARMQPQPVNVVGELYVGGVGVGRGYLRQPELTAERFLPNPFRPGEHMYRTGDLARWLNDGVAEFIGRNDHQIKLRGFRIELGEVEAAIAACRGVRTTAVLLREDAPGRRELVAYVAADRSTDANSLRSALKARLPDYMVPAVFTFLAELPRLANGKIDRKSLPQPDTDAGAMSRLAPRSPLESTLLDIWHEVLVRPDFGIHDNFFDLGGHSLSATQIISRIGATFQIELPLRSIFEHPTIEELAQVVDRLLADPSSGERSALAPIERVSREQPLPVSFSQRRMWVLHEMDPQGGAYNMREALRLLGPLRHAALKLALDDLVARHEAFRTTFEFGEVEPMAFSGDTQAANLVEVDLRSTPADERAMALERLAARMTAEPFDLANGPLHRFILLQLDEQDHALILVMHHIIGDNWSWAILLGELQTLYRAHLHGQRPPLAPRAIDFVDYASWQRQHVNDQVLAAQTRYWLGQLAGMSALELPVDAPVTRRLSSRGARIQQAFAAGWFPTVQRFSARHGLSPFMVLLAAFQALLARYCGQQDISVGTPIAGRTRVEAEQVVGSLVNTLVLRADVQSEGTFRDLLRRTRESCLSAFTHQDVPFDYLVERLRGQSPNGQVPEIRVLFNVLNTPPQLPRLEGLVVSSMPLTRGVTQFDLALTIDTENEHNLSLSYSTELFAPATAQGLLENYLLLLERLMQAPDQRLQDHGVASAGELARLASWNLTVRPFPHDTTVHALLAAQGHANGVALWQNPGGSLSYRELWAMVRRLARMLRSRGVRRGCLVGLCMEREPVMVAAQLAVLCAGGAYVPLDPAYPTQRLLDMAQDARLTLLLTQRALAQPWQALDLPMLLLDAADIAMATPDDAPLPADAECDAGPQDPAYVIYTSGSTGKPKGVVVPHRAVVNFLVSMQAEPGLGAQDVMMAVTTLSFDIAVLELLLPLSVGATVVLASRDQAADGLALRSVLERSQATTMQATPSTWRLLTDAGWAGTPTFKALVGGESLPADLAQALLARTGELWNLYGPTETTVWSTVWRVPRDVQAISIGRPIANTTVHVLDGQGAPCPLGVSGEIFIGGDGVALGYLHRPQLSAERFVVDPFSPQPNARLYRTGDRGRWRHDGLLEHQGRLDFQVKVRGHRIELGEIETQLQLHPSVSQCLVLARQDAPGEARLVAYVVAREAMPDAKTFKEHLRATLPDYMLPQHYVALPALPLLPNGKIDRLALPAPVAATRTGPDPADAPQTPSEIAFAEVWGRVLGLETVGRFDNFFDLGGDSIQASRAVIEFQRACGVRLEIRRLIFETLAQVAGGIELPIGGSPQAEAAPSGASKTRWFRRLVPPWR